MRKEARLRGVFRFAALGIISVGFSDVPAPIIRSRSSGDARSLPALHPRVPHLSCLPIDERRAKPLSGKRQMMNAQTRFAHYPSRYRRSWRPGPKEDFVAQSARLVTNVTHALPFRFENHLGNASHERTHAQPCSSSFFDFNLLRVKPRRAVQRSECNSRNTAAIQRGYQPYRGSLHSGCCDSRDHIQQAGQPRNSDPVQSRAFGV